jgi:hypothetical protein
MGFSVEVTSIEPKKATGVNVRLSMAPAFILYAHRFHTDFFLHLTLMNNTFSSRDFQ